MHRLEITVVCAQAVQKEFVVQMGFIVKGVFRSQWYVPLGSTALRVRQLLLLVPRPPGSTVLVFPKSRMITPV